MLLEGGMKLYKEEGNTGEENVYLVFWKSHVVNQLVSNPPPHTPLMVSTNGGWKKCKTKQQCETGSVW